MFSGSVSTELNDIIFDKEYSHLNGETYLDHTGAALYTNSQITNIDNDLKRNLYGNPHSGGLASKKTVDTIDQIRYRVLQHFNTNPEEYSVIFTSGATAALKIVAETYRFGDAGKNGKFVHLQDNHTSVLGMREIIAARNIEIECISFHETFNSFNKEIAGKASTQHSQGNSLFVFPAQCNFSGLKYPLSWIEKCQKGILNERSNWACLLDAATFVSTCHLDLSIFKPDFVTMSFYKMFGYPTGLGALLVRNCSSHLLDKVYYGGGTVLMALSSEMFHVKRPLLHERFEDGTLNFLSIISLQHGFTMLKELYTDMKTIAEHCLAMARYLHHKLLHLHHSNGNPAAVLYHDTDFENQSTQGNIVNFNILRCTGDFVGYAEVQNLANLHKIHLRTGCFCNPGACQRHLNHSTNLLRHHFKQGHVCGDDQDLVDGQPTGSVRVSFGPYSRRAHADQLIKMIEDCFVVKPAIYRIPDSWIKQSEKLMKKFREGVDEVSVLTEKVVAVNGSQTSTISDSLLPVLECRLHEINLYPIKSCGSLSVASSWILDCRGLQYDRQWMVVSASGVALTQKTEPNLCLIKPQLNLSNEELILRADGHNPCSVKLQTDDVQDVQDVSMCQSKVCGDCIAAIDCGNEVSSWLSSVLNRPGIRLIQQSPKDNRTVKQARNEDSSGKSLLSLSNQSQYLLVNKASIDWLSNLLPEGSDCKKESMVDRFRANLVVDGPQLEPFIEQTWKAVRIGNVLFKVTGPCRRCQMICIDQKSGKKTNEPLTTLAASLKGKLQFGIYLSCQDTREQLVINKDEIVEVYC
ncbi:molybdenum cofactor sulfurase 3 [Nilaparvata lugens]|uniref:molybdenum cofactor sulfurase 3 n=1 Tax=Nilaparvata lugens TaxID=108931 RepID=UPI00193C8C33|nr:molybdenum cofactor sulfurase 3 [Nilaparvata lugens]